jgi:hypothetical protein
MRRISWVGMLALHEVVRDAGRSLTALTGDDFIDGLSETFAGLLPAFHVGRATISDSRGARVGPVIVVATERIEHGEIDADAVAVAIFACAQLDEANLRAGYECIAQVKALDKTPSKDPSRSTVTLGAIVAATSSQSLDSIAQVMRRFNNETTDSDLRPDMVAVLNRGTINYLVTFGPDQTMPGDWLPPARGDRDFVPAILLHMVTTATSTFALNKIVGLIIGQLAFFAPTLERPDMRAAIVGVPANRTVVILYQYDLAGRLVELHKTEPVATPPFLIESPEKELLGKMFYQPWQDGGIVILEGRLPLEGLLIFAPTRVSTNTTKLKNERQVSSVLPMSFDNFKTFAAQIAKRSNLTVRQPRQEFTIAHLADEGTSTPFVSRLWMTPIHLRGLVLSQKTDIDAFDAVYQSVLNDLLTLRRIGRETFELWNDHAKRVASGEIVRYQNGIHVDQTIDEPLSHNLETIIKNSAGVAKQIQHLTRIFGVKIGFMFEKDPGFEAGITALESTDSMFADYMRETRKWLQPLTLVRNDLEHKPFVAPRIQYVRKPGDVFEVREPEVLGLPLTSFVPVILSRLNRFVEEVVIRSMQTAMPSPMTITEVPTAKRDPIKPERFTAGVIGQIQPWQIIYSDDAFDDV